MTKKLIIVTLFVFLAGSVPVTRAGEEIKSSELGTITVEKALYNLADKLTELLLSARHVIAVNQELINLCPNIEHYHFKGFVPAVVGTKVGRNFYLNTGINIKQTSLKIRNPVNAPNKWEKKSLESFQAPDYPKGTPITEVVTLDGKKIYHFIKPVYVNQLCLQCHGKKEDLDKNIREFLEFNYPNDMATNYKEGEVRGGISVTIPVTEEVLGKAGQP